MRILVSNPDTIGDVVLRQPLLGRLARDGHELAVVVRPLVEPLIDLIAPEAQVIRCEAPPYEIGLEPSDARLDPVAAAAAEFDPQVVIAAPWQQTPVESRLLNDLTEARRIGFAGRRFFDPGASAPPAWTIPLDTSIDTPVETPELRKNELLGRAALGKSVRLGDPRLTLSDDHKAMAEAALEKLGLRPGAYLVACVGHNKWTGVRNWRLEAWAEALTHWKTRHGRDVLLIGAEDERERSGEVRQRMGDAGADCAEWFGDARGDVATLAGLIGMSRAYFGRDTGPMHLAAALKRPVVAVFGGGTWPRFVPAVDPSVTVTISVPCAGCEWRCDLEDSHCIKEVPVAEVIGAIDQLESGSVKKRTTRALKPPPALAARIATEMTRAARRRLVEVSVERYGQKAEGSKLTATQTKELEAARGSLEQERRRRLELEAELKVVREQRGVDQERAGYLDGRLEKRTEDLIKAREERAELKAKLEAASAAQAAAAERSAARIESLERQLAEQRQERERLAARMREIGAEAESARASAEQMRSRLEAESRRAEALAKSEASLQERLGQLQGRVKQLQAQAGGPQQPGTIRDLELQMRRARSDLDAAMSLSRQREQEIVVVQSRLNDLLASRWRKLGQRLGVAMTLPWEEQTRNGRA
ncbi:MAG: glycosyltransferase family 9 protein [Phycisphaerales bacterium JB039]